MMKLIGMQDMSLNSKKCTTGMLITLPLRNYSNSLFLQTWKLCNWALEKVQLFQIYIKVDIKTLSAPISVGHLLIKGETNKDTWKEELDGKE